MIVVSDNLTLGGLFDNLDEGNPVIGPHNDLNIGNLSVVNQNGVNAEDPNFPAINMINPSTAGTEYFQQLTGGDTVEIIGTFSDAEPRNYIGIAGHNLGTNARTVEVYGATVNDGSGNPIYSLLVPQFIPGNDRPIMAVFDTANYISIKIVLSAISTATDVVHIAVCYIGELIVIERKIQVTFTPITYGRDPEVLTNRSEAGQFLGRLVLADAWRSSANFMYITASFYRENLDSFVEECATTPFFFAWAPILYPEEVGYAWMTNVPQPQIHDPTNLNQITFAMEGLA